MSEEISDKEIIALISLLDDEDVEIIDHVSEKIISLGDKITPYLERHWEANINPSVQSRIEDLIHRVQFGSLKDKLFNWKNSSNQDIIEGLWIISTYQYPDTDLDVLYNKINILWNEVRVFIKDEMSPEEKLTTLNDFFFKEKKFSANTKNFHSPANSMINVVLDTHKGNPITLCMVYMLIANRLQIPLFGVNLPNLFVLTYKSNETQFYINVFNRGLIFTKKDIQAYVEQLKLDHYETFYEPCSHVDIVTRVLRNLTVSFEKLGETEKVSEIRELLEMLKN